MIKIVNKNETVVETRESDLPFITEFDGKYWLYTKTPNAEYMVIGLEDGEDGDAYSSFKDMMDNFDEFDELIVDAQIVINR